MIPIIKSILDFSVFRPEPDDPEFSWKSRFAGRPTALIHVGRSALSYGVIDAKGKLNPGDSTKGDVKEAFASLGPAIRGHVPTGWSLISLDTQYVITVESNLSRQRGTVEALKKDPRSVLQARYEKGKRYTAIHHPEVNSTLLLACDEELITKIETQCTAQKLKVGRIACGTFSLLSYALSKTNTKKGMTDPVSALYVICCHGSVCILSQERDVWGELRSRPDVYTNDLKPLVGLVEPFHERIEAGVGIVLACDEPIEGLPEALAEVLPERPITDLTEVGLLAKILYTH